MVRYVVFFVFQFVLTSFTLAQNTDTLRGPTDSQQVKNKLPPDTVSKKRRSHSLIDSFYKARADSLAKDTSAGRPLLDTVWLAIAAKFPGPNFIRTAYKNNDFFGFSANAVVVTSNIKRFEGKESLFYTLTALLLFFAFIRVSFPKYLVDLFRVAFRTTLKQRQISEQLVQAPIPSLLLNFFFLLSIGLYLDFVLQHYHWTNGYNFWLLYFYCFIGLAVIYVLKFLSLKFSGWIFNISPVTDSYIFIVFMINKIIGIYLLPFLVLLAFTDEDLYQAAFIISYLGVFALLAYRFILAYSLIQGQVRLHPFHFFLYLCAFEVVPLFLIYKALLLWF